MSFSFIHISDIHLGRPFSDLSFYTNVQIDNNLFKSAVKQSIEKIINFAIEKNIDFILISGDTFDSKEQDFQSKLILKETLKQLDSLNIKTFIICGNHDPLISYNKNTFNFDENSNIKIIGLNTDYYGKFIITDKNNKEIAILHALSYKDEKFTENPISYFQSPNENEKNKFHIGLLHSEINSTKECPYAPCNINDLKSLNYNYWALGHIHKPNIESSNIQYSGTIQARNSKESGCHGIKYIKVENNNIIENLFIPMDTIRYENIEINITNNQDTTETINYIEEEILSFVNKDKFPCDLYLINLNITGNIKFYNEINQNFINILAERIQKISSGKIYISQFINSTSPLIDENVIKEDEGIAGEIYKTISDTNIINNAFNGVADELKNIILKCNYNDEDFSKLKEEIIKQTKDECLILSSNIINNEKDDGE